MPNAGPGEWEGSPFQKGDRVYTASTLTLRDYSVEGHRRRLPNRVGTVGDLSNSHGLCFRVDYEGGGYGYFDPDELSNLLDLGAEYEHVERQLMAGLGVPKSLLKSSRPEPKTRYERLREDSGIE